jgi:hypothetical protein
VRGDEESITGVGKGSVRGGLDSVAVGLSSGSVLRSIRDEPAGADFAGALAGGVAEVAAGRVSGAVAAGGGGGAAG